MKPFENDLGLAGTCEVDMAALDQFGALPRNSPAKAYSESVSGTGVTAPRMVAGSAPSATATGKGSPGFVCCHSGNPARRHDATASA
jgi:hypothetical protein